MCVFCWCCFGCLWHVHAECGEFTTPFIAPSSSKKSLLNISQCLLVALKIWGGCWCDSDHGWFEPVSISCDGIFITFASNFGLSSKPDCDCGLVTEVRRSAAVLKMKRERWRWDGICVVGWVGVHWRGLNTRMSNVGLAQQHGAAWSGTTSLF